MDYVFGHYENSVRVGSLYVKGYYPYFDHSVLNSVRCDNITFKQLSFASPETALYHGVRNEAPNVYYQCSIS